MIYYCSLCGERGCESNPEKCSWWKEPTEDEDEECEYDGGYAEDRQKLKIAFAYNINELVHFYADDTEEGDNLMGSLLLKYGVSKAEKAETFCENFLSFMFIKMNEHYEKEGE